MAMGDLILPSHPSPNPSRKFKNQLPWQLELKSLDEKWNHLLKTQLYSDVFLIVGETQDLIECHRLLLIIHSPVFESMLSARWSRSSSSTSLGPSTTSNPNTLVGGGLNSSQEELYLPDDDPKILKLLLSVIYNSSSSQQTILQPINVDDSLSLLLVAKKYICPHVITACIQHLKLNTTETNVIQIFQIARLVEEPELEHFAENFILTKACNLARIGEFNKLTKDELIHFVQRDDLNIDEVELFNAVYKWGEMHSSKDEDTEINDNQQKITTTETAESRRRSSISEALQNILPLIRFPCMSLEDFSVQVVSKDILPLQETVQVYKYLSTPVPLPPPQTPPSSSSSTTNEQQAHIQFCTQPRSRKLFTYIFKRLKGHGFDFGRKWQNLVFQVDQNIKLVSLGFFRSVKLNVNLCVGIKILNYDLDELYYEFEDENVCCTSYEEDVVHVKFPKPFEVVKNKDYTISYIVKGEETFYKSSEPINIQLACCTDKKITFWIKESKSDTDLDQMPEMCFQLFG